MVSNDQGGFMKSKQLILMVCTLVTSISFFLPWVTMDPNFNTFATSTGGYSGLTIIAGIGYGVQMLSAFGTAYGFPYPAELLYIGYLLLLMPILGIIGFIGMGLRKKSSIIAIRVQAIMTLILNLLVAVVILMMPDFKELASNVLNLSYGIIVMNIAAVLSLVYSFI